MSSLPERYRILPHAIEFVLPSFEDQCYENSFVQSPVDLDVSDWFNSFCDDITSSVGKSYFPIVRLSDGEFLLLFGPRMASVRASTWVRLKSLVRVLLFRINPGSRVVAGAEGIYPSGDYGLRELPDIRSNYGQACRLIAQHGRLALHLEHSDDPFLEQYFPALGRWIRGLGLSLTLSNYIPFYFVYALLSGPRLKGLLGDRRVLIVTHAEDEKRRRIQQTLQEVGVADVSWSAISERRSAFDVIDVDPETLSMVDVVFVGGGLGAPMLIVQLKGFSGPVIDVGFMLEVWANPDLGHVRPYARVWPGA